MPQTLEVTVYTFDELSDDAKEKARGWYREATGADDTYFSESVVESLQTAATALGVEIGTHTVRLMGGGQRQAPNVYWSLSYSQGDGASFDGWYTYSKGAAKKLAETFGGKDLATLQALAHRLEAVQRPHFYSLTASIKQSGRYTHSGTMSVSAEDQRGDDYFKQVSEDEVEQVLRELADWFFHSLREAYEWEQADEQVDEAIRANEYTFTVEGAHY